MLQTVNAETTEINFIAGLVGWKYGSPKVVPLWAVANALLYDLAHSGMIPAFTEAVYVEDVPGIQPRLVPVYNKRGLRAGDMFVVVVPASSRIGLCYKGNAVWFDANTVEEALLIYEMGDKDSSSAKSTLPVTNSDR
ncbi:hypothetical protein ELH61_02250 [Rhizobium ruizarguesonis]|nr:hypothetical protein ELH61_02250 [Rhizobium ruizarguesonis]